MPSWASMSSFKMGGPKDLMRNQVEELWPLLRGCFLVPGGGGGWADAKKVVACTCHLPSEGTFFSFWPCRAAFRILLLRPGIEPMPPALGAQSLNHWTTGEVLRAPS